MTRRCLWFGTLIFAGLACASAQKVRWEKRDRLAAEIIKLDGEIRHYRQDLGLPSRPRLLQQMPTSRKRSRPAMTPRTRVCQDVCDLARFICEAKDDICHIADELGQDDTWAQQKCRGAKASCGEANARCEICVQNEPPGEAAPPPEPVPAKPVKAAPPAPRPAPQR